jgi:hypothetical protein
VCSLLLQAFCLAVWWTLAGRFSRSIPMSKDKKPQCLSFNVSLMISSWLVSPSGLCSRIVEPFVNSASIWAINREQVLRIISVSSRIGCLFQPGGRQIYAGGRKPTESSSDIPKPGGRYKLQQDQPNSPNLAGHENSQRPQK